MHQNIVGNRTDLWGTKHWQDMLWIQCPPQQHGYRVPRGSLLSRGKACWIIHVTDSFAIWIVLVYFIRINRQSLFAFFHTFWIYLPSELRVHPDSTGVVPDTNHRILVIWMGRSQVLLLKLFQNHYDLRNKPLFFRGFIIFLFPSSPFRGDGIKEMGFS